jgi:stress response protein YsnF
VGTTCPDAPAGRRAKQGGCAVLNDRELSSAVGSTAYDTDGDKIGTVEHFFVDDRTGAPTWVAVTTGLFGTRHSVVPAHDAAFADGALRLNVPKEVVKASPSVPDTGHLDPSTEAELRRHYGLEATGTTPAPAPVPAPPTVDVPASSVPPPPEPAGRHAAPDPGGAWSTTPETSQVPVGAVSGDTEPPGPVAVPDEQVTAAHEGTAERRTDGGMVRTEEQLRVGTERVAARRVRLVKYVVTEDVQVTVPLRREEVRVEELPFEGEPVPLGEEETLVAEGAAGAPGLPDEIVLHAERPVVSVEVVPVERVRLRTEEVAGLEQVSDRLTREQIVVDRS